MDGCYEWKPDESLVRFVRRRRELFCVAGLWKDVEKPAGSSKRWRNGSADEHQ
jgi:putative SOS response-associated peptidase YedK